MRLRIKHKRSKHQDILPNYRTVRTKLLLQYVEAAADMYADEHGFCTDGLAVIVDFFYSRLDSRWIYKQSIHWEIVTREIIQHELCSLKGQEEWYRYEQQVTGWI